MKKRRFLPILCVFFIWMFSGCSQDDETETAFEVPKTAAGEERSGGQITIPADESGTGQETVKDTESEAEEERNLSDESEAEEETVPAAESVTQEETNLAAESVTGEEANSAAESVTQEETNSAVESVTQEEMNSAVEHVVKEESVADQETVTTTESVTGQETAVRHGFFFQNGGVMMEMNEDVGPVLNGLGAWSNYAESPSCAFRGIDKIYSYGGFDIYTYPDGDVDHINSIYFTDNSVSTPEGIRIGSSLEEMLNAYGNGYTEEYGVYSYTREDSTLSFIVTQNVVESVEYMAIIK